MKTIQLRKWVLFAFLSAVVTSLKAQAGYDGWINVALQNVVFTSDGHYGYMNDEGQWCKHDGTVLSGPQYTCPANGNYCIFYNPTPGQANSPASSMPATPTHHTITIQTVNTKSSSSANTGYTYNITLYNVNIDRSAYASPSVFTNNQRPGAPFDAGDDLINVNITLVGENKLVGDVGRNAALCYTRYDGPNTGGYWHGSVGNGKLTIGGTGSLTVSKPAEVNSGAAIGSKQINGVPHDDCVSNGHIVINSGTIIAESLPPVTNVYPSCGSYGAAIGGAANCRCGNITINGGDITALAYATAATIGAGGGISGYGADVSGSIKIKGGTVTTYSTSLNSFYEGTTLYNVNETGVGIGAGSSNLREGGAVNAQIEISGGTVTVWKKLSTETEWTYGSIGGGNSNTGHSGLASEIAHPGGRALVKVTGGVVKAANIGGGSANLGGDGANGGYAELIIDMDNANDTLMLTGTIGGGSSISGKGGNAIVTVNEGNGMVYAGNIGGGNSQTGAGGDASVTVYGGNLYVEGKIGGGNSSGAGAGGNASIYVTGGVLDCGSVGGGDSNTGAPGMVTASVSSANPLGAGIYIAGGSKITVKAGSIGGGTNNIGGLGFASAYINTTHAESTIQGQFILYNSDPSRHCFFRMESGFIDNTYLGVGKYTRLKPEGGAVYMTDPYGAVVNITGGTIQNSGGTLGGAVYMSDGQFSMSGTSVIQKCTASQKGGAVYMGGGRLNMTGGVIGGYDAVNGESLGNVADIEGGGFYVTGGTCSIANGTISYNEASIGGGGFYVNTTNANDTTFIKGGATVVHNRALKGGGAYVNKGVLQVRDASTAINLNVADSLGGGIYMANGKVLFNDATMYADSAMYGGGFYVGYGDVEIKNAVISHNVSTSGNGGAFDISNGSLTASASEIKYNRAPNGDGGGAYVGNGDVEFNNGTTVTFNTAVNGGGIYLGGGDLTYNNAVMSDNTATNFGGGIFVAGDITLHDGVIRHNQANSRGGGVYVTGGGDLTMEGGTIGGTTSEGNYTVSSNSYGGGVYMNAGSATLTGGRISGNHTDNNGLGGGIFMGGGTCTLSSGATIGGTSASYANSAKHGGGIYSAGGTITVKGGKMQHNTASGDGGAIYSNGDKAKVYVKQDDTKTGMPSYIEYNTAKNGAGIYALKGLVEFSDGHIQFNKATETGGGIYVGQMDTLYLKGNANLYRNHVPTGKKGGGVYLLGVITVGEQVSNPADLGTITAKENFAYTTDTPDTYVITDETRNNVYLPEPVVNHEHHRDVITVIYNGISTASEVGFSVPSNYVPVIYCANNHEACTETGYEDYTTSQYFLHQFSTGMSLENNLFDDTHHYVAVHYVNQPLVFDPDHVYLYGFWTNIVTTDPTDGHYEEHLDDIDTPEKLAYFISYVNGINDCIGHPHPGAVGNITADIDMSQYGWVPIGELTEGFQGTLNGNGHTITGVSGLLNGEHMAYGIIGQLNGGTVKDLFVKDAVFALEYKDNLIVGGLVGDATNGGTVENSEISCTLIAMHPNTIMGGLIGRMGHGDTPAPTVHSTIAIAEMTGCDMGGLVGHLEKGNLYNSFCNTKFNLLETTEDISDKYIGGLVAVNRGTVENCYARLRGTVPTHNFGIFVGDNTGGTVNYCYAPAGMTNYVKTDGNAPVGSGNYAASQLPYLYGHRDTQVSLVNGGNTYVPTGFNADKQMMVVLNKWVETKNGATGVHPTYTKWGRPWQASDALKPINDDYPVLRMPLANAVASSLDNPYLAYNDIDVLLNNYKAANEAIWMYANDTLVQGENGGDDVSAKLYIDQDVALINANPLKAYVSITLDNSAGAQGMYPTYFEGVPDTTDWHMVSTPLCNAPIGINYTDGTAYEFDYGHPTGMPYYRFYPKGDARNGYFPGMTYEYACAHGFEYNADDTSPSANGNYYQEWDFYSYSEPDYHWINFKRNSASHHHMEAEDHSSIDYDNETRLVPGKGYFAATREETLLQCYGTLNHDEVNYVATRTSGVPRHGYNLLGNPYQAYLNFDAFADANSADTDAIWDDVSNASYTILDEDEPVTGTMVETILGRKPVYYRTYNYGCSSNPDVSAGGFIHPHQGFFVRLQDRDTAAVYFYPDQRNATDTVGSKFRGAREKIDYPLVNLFAMEDNGNADVVTVELGRPDRGGALLMPSLRTGNGKIWCHYEDKDYTIAFTQPGVTEVPIRFETVEDTEYTLTWNTLHGDFSYMHLIDNKTGADIDCLATDHYRFSAKKTDYTSRFKLVFDCTGIEENGEDGSSTGSGTFAFVTGDELVVTGEGMLQVFDVTGRMVMSRELHGVQSTMPMGNMSNGVYVLRLTNGKQSQVQKMVISK